MNKFNTISLVFKIYCQNRLQFANLLANLVRNFITNFDNLMQNFRIWLASFQSTWWSCVYSLYSSQILNQPRNWRGQSFMKSIVTIRINWKNRATIWWIHQFVVRFKSTREVKAQVWTSKNHALVNQQQLPKLQI